MSEDWLVEAKARFEIIRRKHFVGLDDAALLERWETYRDIALNETLMFKHRLCIDLDHENPDSGRFVIFETDTENFREYSNPASSDGLWTNDEAMQLASRLSLPVINVSAEMLEAGSEGLPLNDATAQSSTQPTAALPEPRETAQGSVWWDT